MKLKCRWENKGTKTVEGLEEMREEELIRNILLVVFLTRRSWALFPPATETLETER